MSSIKGEPCAGLAGAREPRRATFPKGPISPWSNFISELLPAGARGWSLLAAIAGSRSDGFVRDATNQMGLLVLRVPHSPDADGDVGGRTLSPRCFRRVSSRVEAH